MTAPPTDRTTSDRTPQDDAATGRTVTGRPLRPERSVLHGLARTLLTPHAPEHYARSLGVSRGDDPTRATVTDIDRSHPDYTVLTLRLPLGVDRPPAGGALGLGIVVDGRVQRRHYSPVDAASPGRVTRGIPRAETATIAVRRHDGGIVSEHLRRSAAVGMELLLTDPVSDAALDDDRPGDVLLLSGGSGITPMLSIAATLATEGHGERHRVAWLHYARSVRDVPFASRFPELRAAGIDARVVETARPATDPAPDDAPAGQSRSRGFRELRGHLSEDHLVVVAPWHAGATLHLCGPDGLADGLEGVLGAERYAEVRRERFAAARTEIPDTDGGTVTHARSGVTADNPGTTLLEGAEAAGLAPAHGCRMGICHTCACVRLSGATRDLRTGVVSEDPGAHVQICVSAPVGDVELDL